MTEPVSVRRGLKVVRSLWWLYRHGLVNLSNVRAVFVQSEPYWWPAAIECSDEEWDEFMKVIS